MRSSRLPSPILVVVWVVVCAQLFPEAFRSIQELSSGCVAQSTWGYTVVDTLQGTTRCVEHIK